MLALAALTALAAAPAPPTVALQYDEISRILMSPATPPPPGQFGDDYQLAMSASPPPSMPAHRRGGFGALGAMMGGAMPGGDPSSAMSAMNVMRTGRLTRYTLYPSKGWVRTDDPIAHTAVIAKCNEHQYITLDMNAKTYTIAQTEPAQNCFPMSMGPRQSRGAPRAEAPSEPGTEDLTVTATSKDLGPLAIDGIATRGTASTISVSMANATGSCAKGNGSASIASTTYISTIHGPRPYCLLSNAPAIPSSPMEALSRGGCQPTVHGHADINFDLGNIERLTLYSLMSMESSEGRGRQFNMLTERGHVAFLVPRDADPLFSIPPDFTEAK
jgi:hypothetical protein